VTSRRSTGEIDGHSLVDGIAAAIQGRVLNGAIARGSRLRQEMLAAEFGVSRTPVREALRKLQASGIVELATTRIGDDGLQRLREAQTLFRRAVQTLVVARRRRRGREPSWDDESAWVRANDVFHLAILDAAGNARLKATIADLHQSFPRDLTWAALSRSSRLLEENVGQHEAVLAAIEQGDAAAARRRMVEHIRAAGELVTLHFERVPNESPAAASV
jgi:DNA-binding GntR family transcriptional regulator